MQKDPFEEMFPKTAQAFGLSAWSQEAWMRAHMARGQFPDAEMWTLADELARRCASHYAGDNLFDKPKFFSCLYQFREKCAIMAGRKQRDVRTQRERAAWQGFIDYRLTEGQLEELDLWSPTASECFEMVDAMLQDGYRITLSYNPGTKLATCTIIDDGANGRKTGGYGISTSDSDCALALKAAVFKHAVVLKGDWSEFLDKPATGRRG